MLSPSLTDAPRLDPETVAAALRQVEADARAKESAEKESWKHFLDTASRREIISRVEAMFMYSVTGPALRVELASSYNPTQKLRELLVWGGPPWPRDHPRRPVIMLGSLRNLCEKHSATPYGSAPTGLCSVVWERWLRFFRITLILEKEAHTAYTKFVKWADCRHPSHHLHRRRLLDADDVYVDGEWQFLEHDQLLALREMRRVHTKVEKLGRRAA